jgi:hypothetical protein
LSNAAVVQLPEDPAASFRFYLSPLADYALALVAPKNADHHPYAYAVRNGALRRMLVEIPWEDSNSHPIVMTPWSAGKYGAQWSAALRKIKDHPLPDPLLPPSAAGVPAPASQR